MEQPQGQGPAELAFRSVTELARGIAAGTLSAVDALEACVAQYEQHNAAFNAVVLTRLEQARKEAAAVDAKVAAGQPVGPLAGVPMTVKEAFDWEGTPTTWGNPDWRDHRPEANAATVQRLLDAGAVIYGKTNVPFLLGDWQSFNDIYGTTNNPWNPALVPGGSSGGSAVALATGMAALELGSDIGGSLRNPAHYCGVASHKPSFGIVPAADHTPPGYQVGLDIAVCGPMARTAGDLALALGVLAGPGPLDAAGYQLDLPEEHSGSLAEFRVGVMLTTPVIETDGALVDVLSDAVDRLAAAGADVSAAVPPFDQHEYFENYWTLLRAATGGHAPDELFSGFASDARRYADGDRDLDARVAHYGTIDHRGWLAANNQREQYRHDWARFFTEYDLLLTPVAASAAFPHDHGGTRTSRTIPVNGQQVPCVDQLFWAGLTCSAYLPSTVVPVGLTADTQLPVGIGVTAPFLHDYRSIAYAGLIERTIGGFVPPPVVVEAAAHY